MDSPTQVKFFDPDSQETLYGIAFGDIIICACCGGVFEASEVESIENLSWTNLIDAISGN